ncbi:MAG: hypothetical protein IJ015_02145 [Ruminococcus sp.]|nr:hypothetical protein [Ruminococcus sp.]
MNNNEINSEEKKRERKKALLWSLLWSNVAMIVVLLLTYLFQRYLYTQLSAHALVDVEINPLVVILGYIVGMLILWAIIYKYETKEDELFTQNENHNIY